jgi:hypothetical protein
MAGNTCKAGIFSGAGSHALSGRKTSWLPLIDVRLWSG